MEIELFVFSFNECNLFCFARVLEYQKKTQVGDFIYQPFLFIRQFLSLHSHWSIDKFKELFSLYLVTNLLCIVVLCFRLLCRSYCFLYVSWTYFGMVGELFHRIN